MQACKGELDDDTLPFAMLINQSWIDSRRTALALTLRGGIVFSSGRESFGYRRNDGSLQTF